MIVVVVPLVADHHDTSQACSGLKPHDFNPLCVSLAIDAMHSKRSPRANATGPDCAFQLNGEYLSHDELDAVIKTARTLGPAYESGLLDIEHARTRILEQLNLFRAAQKLFGKG